MRFCAILLALFGATLSSLLTSCNQAPLNVTREECSFPSIFPDYIGVTMPANIAPPNFKLNGATSLAATFSHKTNEFTVTGQGEGVQIPIKAWKRLLQQAMGDSIIVTLYQKEEQGWCRYPSFPIYISNDSIDSYLVYRRIAPGYRMWNEMGIYQRNLENFSEEPIIENRLTNNSCINCHSFPMNSPDSMIFHQRGNHAGTFLIANSKIDRVTITPNDVSKEPSLVYPYWHPTGKFVAFSSNDTKQDFFLSHANRIEVFDISSDIHIADMQTHTLFTSPTLSSEENMETFPTFSPDGKQLYFCSAPTKKMPDHYTEMKYNLLRIAFNPSDNSFGTVVDTLYNAEKDRRSAKHPRLSPDGRYLLYTISDYGNFSIWHRDADLQLLDLQTNTTHPLLNVNSNETESYHSWSSNSRWFVFSSRRDDGLYTRPYICHINKEGKTSKPFVLPQKEADYYLLSLFSFNIPELVKGKIAVPKKQQNSRCR